MRSSKSNPEKYVRKYRSVSQRRMIGEHNGFDGVDICNDELELERLRNILRDSEKHLSYHNERLGSGDHKNNSGLNFDTLNNNDEDDDDDYDDVGRNLATKRLSSRKRKLLAAKQKVKEFTDNKGNNVNEKLNLLNEANNPTTLDSNNLPESRMQDFLIGPEFLEDKDGYDCYGGEYNNNDNALIVAAKKKKKVSSSTIFLTPLELKQARLLRKSTTRKLQQLEKRVEQKQKRQKLYEQLERTALNDGELQLLTQTSQIGNNKKTGGGSRYNKRLYLKKLLQRERAGIQLTPEELDALYHQRNLIVDELDTDRYNDNNNSDNNHNDYYYKESSNSDSDSNNSDDDSIRKVSRPNANRIPIFDENSSDIPGHTQQEQQPKNSSLQLNIENGLSKQTKKNRKKEVKRNSQEHKTEQLHQEIESHHITTDTQQQQQQQDNSLIAAHENLNDKQETAMVPTDQSNDENFKTKQTSSSSIATNLMSSLLSLKSASQQKAEQLEREKENAKLERLKQDEEEFTKYKASFVKPYVPSRPIELDKLVSNMPVILNATKHETENVESSTVVTNSTLSTASANNSSSVATATTKVRAIIRPTEIEETRYNLPINQMEYEVVDAIRNHDVTIICAETGSGKSTQVPQFLYENYFSLANSDFKKKNDQNDVTSTACRMIGVTQPRRVAAVSTAKRVCYEMGCGGNGQRIFNKNSIVAYQTRYETAGLGNETHIKFMTDGILLQEIQSDLLLRKYNVIVLDEAHERNLNTDCLIGLLSVALPLRKRAALEEEQQQQQMQQGKDPSTHNSTASTILKPLKVIIMSATLRVEDFTNNDVFPSSTTTSTVVTVPGRSHPVTIHHNKVTQLDDYEDAVFRKTCKIHRKLPAGGVLVFLTGKQEIIRMVNRLRRCFRSKETSKTTTPTASDAFSSSQPSTSNVAVDTVAMEGDHEHSTIRDLDDDEVDGDIFTSNHNDDNDDFDDVDKDDEDDPIESTNDKSKNAGDDGYDIDNEEKEDDGIPKKVIILPLYSLLSAEEQARVFAPVPEGYRLIVVATNIAETSITIPDIKYVVDSGRQKCRNYNSASGVASFNIMWISRAAADQRAGRAGRTGPGHCYRLYSSTMYSKHMDPYALPEVLTRPLEDVILSMKAMQISCISKFPFPTPPDKRQIDAALKLLSNLGCVDIGSSQDVVVGNNSDTNNQSDGTITRLGRAVAKLPLGVRCGKIMLVAAQAGILDYAIVIVAAISEQSPFVRTGHLTLDDDNDFNDSDGSDADDGTKPITKKKTSLGKSGPEKNNNTTFRWVHRCGDLLATLHVVGAYTYAGHGMRPQDAKDNVRKFCENNGINPVIMERIQKMRSHLTKLARSRLSYAEGVAAKTGGYTISMTPPNKLQEQLLCQSIVSGLLDNVAMLAPLGSIPGQHPFSLRSAYLGCTSSINNKEPLFMDRNSVVYSRDARMLPKWICYESVLRKTWKDGTPVAIMKNITPIEPNWLGQVAMNSKLLSIGEPIATPIPMYDANRDAIMCSAKTNYGSHKWEIPSVRVVMFDALQTEVGRKSSVFLSDDSFRWFGRYFLEGKVIPEMKQFHDMLNDSPNILTRGVPSKKVSLYTSALAGAGIDSVAALREHWSKTNANFLYNHLVSHWIQKDRLDEFRPLWIQMVKSEISIYNERANPTNKIMKEHDK